jgi:hypothetical protein
MQERLAVLEDLDQIMVVIKDAKEFLKKQEIDQWQDGFPDEMTIREDILHHKSYAFVEKEEIIGFMVLNLGEEPSYQTIYDGEWKLNNRRYLTIHRTAIRDGFRGKGLSLRMFFLAEQVALQNKMKSIRIDTHRDNQLMQHLCVKYGYEYCGVIHLVRSDVERIAYEKVLI